MTGAWLSLIGIGEDGLDGLSAAARRALDAADMLVGGERHLAKLPADGRPRHPWPTPMKTLVNDLPRLRPARTAVLCSGDPLWFGVGAHIVAAFPHEEVAVFPGPSAGHLVCARMGWPLHAVDCVSVHGRPLATLAVWLRPDARLVVLAQDGDTPAAVAQALVDAGYGASAIAVFNRMGGPEERRIDGRADSWAHGRADDLCTLAVACRPTAGAPAPASGPGLPDDAFVQDGMLTKREARAAALAKLGGGPMSLLWDVGAGCGSMGIEWMRAGAWRRALAIEPRADRRALIETNRLALGAPQLTIVEGAAPAVFAELPAPDAIFIGGGLSAPGLLDQACAALKPGGRLVAHAATPDGEAALVAAHAARGGELARLSVSRVEAAGQRLIWQSRAPITQWGWGVPA